MSQETASWWSPAQTWTSGDWSIDVRGDELADIRFAGRPVLRGVKAVVRDPDWATVPTRVMDAELSPAALVLRLDMEGLGLSLSGTLTARAEGDALEIAWRATSAHDAQANRAGLVVLHPPSLAGRPLVVRHPDGTTTDAPFPNDISPHQPALDIAGLDWAGEGLDVRLDLSGDVFEMEDQRNWTDASFKTYSRPLSLPFPYPLAAGEVVVQTLRLEVTVADASVVAPPDRVELSAGGTFPSLGAAAATAPDPAPPGLAQPAWMLVELDLATPNWRAALDRAARAGAPLDVRIVAEPGDDLDAVVSVIAGLRVLRVGVYDHVDSITLPASLDELRKALAGRGIPIVGGSRAHFTELSRGFDVIPGDLEALTFSVTPLFHALDTDQLVESVAMQRVVAAQAVAMAAGRDVHVGPVTLRPRFNNVASRPQPGPTRADLTEGYGAAFADGDDPRIAAEQLAAWTIASAAALAVPGVATLSYFEQWGPRGVVDAGGRGRPVARVLKWIAELDGATLLSGASPDGELWAVGGVRESGVVILAANIGRAERAVTVSTPSGEAHVRLAPGGATRLELGG